MHPTLSIIATLLTVTLTNAMPIVEFHNGRKGTLKDPGLMINMFASTDCTQIVPTFPFITTNINTSLSKPAVAYMLSRDLTNEEILDFSSDKDGDQCGLWRTNASGDMRKGSQCHGLAMAVDCFRLWTPEEAKKLGDM